ncbi:MAG: Lipoprotein signal peptidase [Syntrophus sp. PtaU1.Bin005]|jgi:signal peptidase II|uniref:signal peptidase II n=1 Tax=Syntrophus buswellii TaxID=43774 RepID=UPI0009D634FB|nr:MAG: Lipoprotein signal peptidase [Syntrophus sp. PtaB.Bin138]OPY81587.1 MAG: Lipoprotein signal peptidase [Syntrophus sp. PtaU1.Bin005]
MTRKSLLIFFLTAGLVILLDQLTKCYVVSSFQLYESVPVISGFFNLTYIRNPGAAFGFLSNASPFFRGAFFSLVTLVAAGLILYYLLHNKIEDLWLLIPLAFILAGALGNLADRYRFGEVIDFLDVYIGPYHWPAFNVADSAISIGALFLIVDMLKRRNEEL